MCGVEHTCHPFRCMKNLTEDAVREIGRIHSSWIAFEVTGKDRRLLTLCADDIEFWPPDAQPILGRAAVLAQLGRGSKRIQAIEIGNRRIRGSGEIAYLTASYKTVFSSAGCSTSRQAIGAICASHGKPEYSWPEVRLRELLGKPTLCSPR